MLPKLTRLFVFLFCVTIIATVAQTQSAQLLPSNTTPVDRGGFLTVDSHVSNRIRVDPQVNWERYRSYRLMPAVYEPDGSRRSLSARDAAKATGLIDRSLQKTFKPSGGDGDASLEVRPILMAVKRTNTMLNVLGFAAIQAPISFGAATVRYELFDSETGRQIGVISCRRAARPWNVYPWNFLRNFEALGQSSVILASDSRRLRRDIERLSKVRMDSGHASTAGSE